MSSGSTIAQRLRMKNRMQELMQDFIESHKLGHKLARKQLGETPQFLVIEKLKNIYKVGRTGIQLLDIQFNSEKGGFHGSIAIKEFESTAEAQRLINLNKWLLQRVFTNSSIKVPDIFSAGGRFVIYEGIEGETFEKSRINLNTKLNLAGQALSTFHSTSLAPIDKQRYPTLLQKMVDILPIDSLRKERLKNLGFSLFQNYIKENSGIYGYGDFHPGNLMIGPEGQFAYLIDPEFIESTIASDRFEDIANFFIFDATNEFLQHENFNETISQITIFLQAYDSFILNQGINIDVIYKHTQWIALYFHLGLTALIKGAVATKFATNTDSETETSMEEIINSYRMAKQLWQTGAKILPTNAQPSGI